MNSNSACILLCKMSIHHFKELIHYVVWWSWSIDEEQIVVGNIILEEIFLIVLLFVQSDHSSNTKLLKYFNVLLWMVTIPLICISLLYWSHEGHEFAWNDPVDITILNPFVEFIFFYVESTEIIPFELNGILESLKTLEHCTLVETVSFWCITIWL